MDRRFNRARYDADQTVAAFAARLKDAVDLDSVRDDLVGIVHQALEPAHVSVWISQRGMKGRLCPEHDVDGQPLEVQDSVAVADRHQFRHEIEMG